MAKEKFVAIKNCSISYLTEVGDGDDVTTVARQIRLTPGDVLSKIENVRPEKVAKLVRYGMVVDASTSAGEAAVAAAVAGAAEEKARLSGKSKDPSVVPQKAKASMPAAA